MALRHLDSSRASLPLLKAADLFEKLLALGCNPELFRIADRGGFSDAHCLAQRGGRWEVFYSERGQHGDAEFSSDSEEEAASYFQAKVLSMRHDHCVGFFESAAEADALEARLRSAGLASRRDLIPYSSNGGRHRLFVFGSDVFAARALLCANFTPPLQ